MSDLPRLPLFLIRMLLLSILQRWPERKLTQDRIQGFICPQALRRELPTILFQWDPDSNKADRCWSCSVHDNSKCAMRDFRFVLKKEKKRGNQKETKRKRKENDPPARGNPAVPLKSQDPLFPVSDPSSRPRS